MTRSRQLMLAFGLCGLFVWCAPPAGAALIVGDLTSPTLDRFLPRSPVILRVQILLGGLGLYRGARDGRTNDDLSIAVKRYQNSAGIKPDGRANEELLRHIEFSREANKLLSRLRDVSVEQRALARQKLARTNKTRDLLDAAKKKFAADPSRDTRICFDAPTVACLLNEAVETAKAIHRPHFRDWAFGEIAVVQARIGKPAAARVSAGRIEDPRLIIVALRNIAQAQAGAGYLAEARESAAAIPDGWSRAEAMAALAVATAGADDWPAARGMVERVESLLPSLPGERPRTEFLAKLARGLAGAGDPSAAFSLLERERARLTRLGATSTVFGDEATLATAYADLNRSDIAAQIISGKDADQRLRTPLMAIARAQARAGRDRQAAATLVRIKEARYRVVAQADVSELQLAAGRRAVGLRNLRYALTATRSIEKERTYTLSHALGRISEVWRKSGQLEDAKETADQIPTISVRMRAYALIEAARIRADPKKGNRQIDFDRMTLRLHGKLNQVWLASTIVLALVESGAPDIAASVFSRAVEVVGTMVSAWARAQGLVRLTNTLATISRVEK